MSLSFDWDLYTLSVSEQGVSLGVAAISRMKAVARRYLLARPPIRRTLLAAKAGMKAIACLDRLAMRRALLAAAEEPLSGGDVSGVVRVGETVRRPIGPWSPAVHSLLRHFEQVGFEAPRVLGTDIAGREILSFVPGDAALSPVPASDEAVVALAKLLRRMHDSQAGYRPPADAAWQALGGDQHAGEVICHNDLFWPNVICRKGLPAALIDWDLAAPGRRLDDLASAAYFWLPLRSDTRAVPWGLPSDRRPERLRLLCDSYGLGAGERARMFDAIIAYCIRNYELHHTWGALEQRPGWRQMWESGSGQFIVDNLAYLEYCRAVFERALK
jgi:Phosphotransferase enzyme family